MEKLMIAIVLLAMGVGFVVPVSSLSCKNLTDKDWGKLENASFGEPGPVSPKEDWCKCMYVLKSADKSMPPDFHNQVERLCAPKLYDIVKQKYTTEIIDWATCVNCLSNGYDGISSTDFDNNTTSTTVDIPSSSSERYNYSVTTIAQPLPATESTATTTNSPTSLETSSVKTTFSLPGTGSMTTTFSPVSDHAETSGKPNFSPASTEWAFNVTDPTAYLNDNQSANDHLAWSIPLICVLLVALVVGGYFIHRRTKQAGYVQSSSSSKTSSDSVKKISEDV